MSESQKTTYGIIGNPVGHSLSPIMHNTAFEALKVDAEYKLFPLEDDELTPFFESLRDENSPVFGLNVTVPYKAKALQYIDNLSPLAEKIGAVNTIVISKDRKLTGYNTDAPGFLTHLEKLGFDVQGKRIAILGAGGSCRAILGTLCMIPERPEAIRIYNRTASRMESLMRELGERIDLSIVEVVHDVDDLNIELADMLVNTTSVGLKPEDPLLVDEYALHSGLLVYDLIYRPAETELLRVAADRGAQTANGLDMLFYQGVLSLQHWAHMELPEEVKIKMKAAIEKELLNDRF